MWILSGKSESFEPMPMTHIFLSLTEGHTAGKDVVALSLTGRGPRSQVSLRLGLFLLCPFCNAAGECSLPWTFGHLTAPGYNQLGVCRGSRNLPGPRMQKSLGWGHLELDNQRKDSSLGTMISNSFHNCNVC